MIVVVRSVNQTFCSRSEHDYTTIINVPALTEK